MPRSRRALALALCTALLGTGVAGAASKPVKACKLVIDERGDAGAPVVHQGNSEALDVISADVATGAKNLTAVIRVANLAPDPYTQLGKGYDLGWVVKGSWYHVRVFASPTGVQWTYGTGEPGSANLKTVGDARGSFDPATSMIRFVVPKKAVGVTKGATLTQFGGYSWAYVGAFAGWDHVEGAKKYVDGTPSCVPTS